MQPYKLTTIKRPDIMQAVIFKAQELGYRLRDPRQTLEELYMNHDYMILTDTGAIIFINNESEYLSTGAVEIDMDFFNLEKPVAMVTVTMPEPEFKLIQHRVVAQYPDDCKPQNWRVEQCQ